MGDSSWAQTGIPFYKMPACHFAKATGEKSELKLKKKMRNIVKPNSADEKAHAMENTDLSLSKRRLLIKGFY